MKKEIDAYINSESFVPEMYIAATENDCSASQLHLIDSMWNEAIADSSTGAKIADYDESFQSGFVSAALAIQAANDYACTKMTWSQKPPQSKADMSVVGRIQGDDQKYQRLFGKCATKDCDFKMVFRLSAGTDGGYATYKIDSSFHCSHNHAVCARCPEKLVNGYVMIEKMEQLTQPERNDIMKHARASLTPPSVLREILFKTYGRMYCERLILNAMQYAKQISARMLEKDTSMNEFYSELDKIRDQGGRWKDSKRGDGTLKTVYIQTKSMRGFAKQYHKVVVVDATFGTNKYGLKLVPYLGIDCLGKSQIMGVAFLPTENGAEIFEALDFFGLKNK